MRSTYEVEIPLSDDNHDQELSSNKILFRKSVNDIKNMVLEFILNLSAGYFDIYSNGTLISSGGAGSTFANISGNFYPCVLATGKGLRVDFISQLEVPQVTPGNILTVLLCINLLQAVNGISFYIAFISLQVHRRYFTRNVL